ncbi:MAG: transposase [Bacteroidales bacterium]|nr:transposase [Bacteroidales bacterium]
MLRQGTIPGSAAYHVPVGKPGRRSKSLNVFSLTKKLINYLRQRWPETLIILRGDSHFCSMEFMDWSEGNKKAAWGPMSALLSATSPISGQRHCTNSATVQGALPN